jgi:tRNA 2-thiouridine synthesizing protein D
VAAAQRRGIVDEDEAKRHGKDAPTSCAPVSASPVLGQLIEAGIQSDRLVVFGD